MNTTKTNARDFCHYCGAPTAKLVWSLDDDLNDIEIPACIDCADENVDGLDGDSEYGIMST